MLFTETPSGLLVPYVAPPPPPDYYDMHRCCPKCGSGVSHTTLGVIAPSESNPDDVNRAWCSTRGCAWKGVVHDCVPKKAT